MQVQSRIRSDLKRWASSDFVRGLSRQFSDYEVRVKEVVRDFDLRSRDAREKSRDQIEKFAKQLKKTRAKVEGQVNTLLSTEGHKLNGRVRQVFNYLKTIAQNEKLNGSSNLTMKMKSSGKAKRARSTSYGKRKTSKKSSIQKRPRGVTTH